MIRYYNRDIDFTFKHKRANNLWLKSVIENEAKTMGQISIVFCSDDALLAVNKEFLGHDYYTDIITFDYCEKNIISGDLMISIDTVKANAVQYGASFEDELSRVMVHGILHLIGYDDHTEEDQKLMRYKEDFYLALR